MKRSRLLRLFPRAWRDRYGDEFSALLEDMGPSITGVVDVVLAAIRVRAIDLIASRRRRPVVGMPLGGDPMAVRSLAFLALVAGVAAAALFLLHSFFYLALATIAVLFAAAAGAARSMLPDASAGRPRASVTTADLVRIVVVALALALLVLASSTSEGPAGRQELPSGVTLDLVAAGAVLAVAIWWWTDRRRPHRS